MDTINKNLRINSCLRYGAELEINSFDRLNRPIGKLPEGISYVGLLIQKSLPATDSVVIHPWSYDHNNTQWVIKPDASCGMEICTPVFKGLKDLKILCKVVDSLSVDRHIEADERCSMHLHIDINHLSVNELNSILTWWIKFEPVFLDCVPTLRKKSQYCQMIGQSLVNIEMDFMSLQDLLQIIGIHKYHTLNAYHFYNSRRKTIEFRIMDNNVCLNSKSIDNWIKLILHFCEMAKIKGMPDSYLTGDRWSGYCWLDPIDLFEFLGFMPNQYNLSEELKEVRQWLLTRLGEFSYKTQNYGIMSKPARLIALKQTAQLINIFKNSI